MATESLAPIPQQGARKQSQDPAARQTDAQQLLQRRSSSRNSTIFLACANFWKLEDAGAKARVVMNEGNGTEAGCLRHIAFVHHDLDLDLDLDLRGQRETTMSMKMDLISGTPSRMMTVELRGLARMSLSSKAVAEVVTWMVKQVFSIK